MQEVSYISLGHIKREWKIGAVAVVKRIASIVGVLEFLKYSLRNENFQILVSRPNGYGNLSTWTVWSEAKPQQQILIKNMIHHQPHTVHANSNWGA